MDSCFVSILIRCVYSCKDRGRAIVHEGTERQKESEKGVICRHWMPD